MRVLWFSNSVPELLNQNVGCSWISSLEKELSKIPEIELGITFVTRKSSLVPFSDKKIFYFPVNNESSVNKFSKIITRWRHQIESEKNIEKYLEVIDEFKPDVIHIFGTESDFGLIISKTNVPCIIHLQGIISIINHKWFQNLTLIDTIKYSKKRIFFKAEGFYHEYFVNKKICEREQQIFKSCKYFMGRTEWDRRLTTVLSPNSKYFHCDELIRSGFWKHEWQEPVAKTFKIMSIMRGNIYKGLETILECKKILIQQFPKIKIEWRIAGIKQEDEISYLLQKKYKVDFKDYYIELLGPMSEVEIINKMLQSNLYVHASHIENSPNSVCEAMLLGMPVIATCAGGTSSIVENNKDGILIQDGDPYALAGAIIELKRDRDQAIKLGVNARTTAIKRQNPEKIITHLLEIYSSISNKIS